MEKNTYIEGEAKYNYNIRKTGEQKSKGERRRLRTKCEYFVKF